MAPEESSSFRDPQQKELKTIVSALRFLESVDFLKNFDIVVKEEKNRREVYAVSSDLKGVLPELEQKLERKLENVGVKIGEVGRRFRFSLEGTFWLARSDKRKVWVNEKGEMLLLYGRDIFASSVVRAKGFKENEIVFVCNEDNDVLGIGKSRFDANKISKVEPNRVVVENLADRGEYLRKKKLYSCF